MSSTEDVETYVAGLKVAELKEELKKLNLPLHGNKATLGQRLREALEEKKRGEQLTQDEEEEEEEEEEVMEEEEEEEAGTEQVGETAAAEQGNDGTEESEAATEEEEENEEEAAEGGEGDGKEEQVKEESTDAGEGVEEAPAAAQQEQKPEAAEVEQKEQSAAAVAVEGQQEPTHERVEEGDEVVVEDEVGGEGADEVGGEEADEVRGEEADEAKKDREEPMEAAPSTDSSVGVGTAAAGGGGGGGGGGGSEGSGENGAAVGGEREDRKRPREEDDRRKDSSRDRRERPDPMRAPDPEDPSEEFSEESVTTLVSEDSKFQPPDDTTITLDNFNSDLHFKISPDGVTGRGLGEQGFAYLWAAAKATWGAKGGKVCYEVKILEYSTVVDLADTEEHPNALRVGWSAGDAGLDLGESPLSYGYGCTGKAVVNHQYSEYGEAYGDGDVITCLLDLESSPPSISFARNGIHLGIAFTLDEDKVKGQCFFPHVFVKNVTVRMNFCEPLYRPLPEGFEEYVPLQSAIAEHGERGVAPPKSLSDCEVIMMVGLPASGKTTWAMKHMRENPNKRYTILGTNQIMDKMKVSGLTRRANYHGRWEKLIKKATDILNRLLVMAGKVPRNYIIDQTNVYAKAQYRKMGYFQGFVRKAVVVIPPHHELRKRTAARNKEMGDPLPEDALNAMKANFHVPAKDNVFDDVTFTEIYGQAANKIIQQYKDDALGLPSFPQNKRPRYDRYDRSPGGPPGRFGPPRGPYGSPGGYRSPYGGSPHYGRGGGGGYPPPGGYVGYRPMYPPYGSPMYGGPPPPPRRGNFGYGPPHPGHSPYGGGRSPYGYPPPPPSRGYYGRY